jgi:hypothetical protein
MSFFRNRNFWYLGNLGPWPPETHYRCVELDDCNKGLDYPPSSDDGKWTPSKKHADSVPNISKVPCSINDEL